MNGTPQTCLDKGKHQRAEPQSTMLFIEDNCRALENVLSSLKNRYHVHYTILSYLDSSSARTDVKFEDFEETKFHVYEDDNGELKVSLSSPSLKYIGKQFEVSQELSGYFGKTGLKVASKEADYDLTLSLDKSGLNGTIDVTNMSAYLL